MHSIDGIHFFFLALIWKWPYPLESFVLFSRDIPSANLGFVDSRASTIEATIHGEDFAIHQSPTLLSSSRAGGTTGAGMLDNSFSFAL
jgi:hypothetical protein